MDSVTTAPELGFTDHQAPPPGPFTMQFPAMWPLTGQDQLRLTVVSAKAGVTVTCSLRTVTQKGAVMRQVFTFTPGSARAIQQQDFPCGDGALVDVSIETPAGAPLFGQVYAMAQLIVGLGGEKQRVSTLCGGYVTQTSPVFGPSTSMGAPVDGPGAVRVIVGAVPAAGVEIVETVPVNARWELLALVASLTTSAAVANRIVQLLLDDGANIYFTDSPAVTQAASLVDRYSFAIGQSKLAVPAATCVMGNVPSDNRLLAGHRIRTSTVAIQGADQWTAPVYVVREWLDL